MKRTSFNIQIDILKTIRKHPNITISKLESKIGTNPSSLREHCKILEFYGLIKIGKNNQLVLSKNGDVVLEKI